MNAPTRLPAPAVEQVARDPWLQVELLLRAAHRLHSVAAAPPETATDPTVVTRRPVRTRDPQ